MKLLSSNIKLDKSESKGCLVRGISLRPGKKVCPDATPGCLHACQMEHSGHGCMPSVRNARDAKTEYFFKDRQAFLTQIHKELSNHATLCKRKKLEPYARPNLSADLAWEKIAPSIFNLPLTYYDYTKTIKRIGHTPPNYHLTYSYNELSDMKEVHRILDAGYNVAVVTDVMYNPSHKNIGDLPKRMKLGGRWYPMVDGDADDIRTPERDGQGVLIGLRGKGGKEQVLEGIRSGFMQAAPGGRLSQLTIKGGAL